MTVTAFFAVVTAANLSTALHPVPALTSFPHGQALTTSAGSHAPASCPAGVRTSRKDGSQNGLSAGGSRVHGLETPQLGQAIVVEQAVDPRQRTPMMTTTKTTPTTPKEQPVPLQLKLAAAWASFMCLYIYVDVLGLYKPGAVDGILNGKVHTFDITEPFFVSALAASAVPTMMILLSTTLPPRANRMTNVVVASVLIPWMAFNLAGGEWPYYHGLGFALELVLLAFIIRSVWTWPRNPSTSMPDSAVPHRAQMQLGR